MVSHFDYKHNCLAENNVPIVLILPSRWQDGAESLGIERTSCLWYDHNCFSLSYVFLERKYPISDDRIDVFQRVQASPEISGMPENKQYTFIYIQFQCFWGYKNVSCWKTRFLFCKICI